eukprot:CAMPEP_0170577672 /NCGR_PEP_ID=MMETSP0224-20130122/5054_1 /TAXON_ID=285029 /ORGANISM="Togula jolla, Strain CCCM 725" /LENGTH=145 /DNA_ID=CAMNT_0010900603 /DNA_START=116 /DNA_END=550 /DNA_ORIENTATION=+
MAAVSAATACMSPIRGSRWGPAALRSRAAFRARKVPRRAAVASEGWQARLEELRAMRLRPLRAELQALGCRVEGCTDKESLLELLEGQGAAALQQQAQQSSKAAAAAAAEKNTFEYQKKAAQQARDGYSQPQGTTDANGNFHEYP